MQSKRCAQSNKDFIFLQIREVGLQPDADLSQLVLLKQLHDKLC